MGGTFSLVMENSTSPATPGVLHDWCELQSYQGTLPWIIRASFTINSTINSILACMTVIGNILILISLKRTSRVHAASKALYCSLAVSDLGVGLFVQPLFVARLLAGREGLTHVCSLMGIIINVAGILPLNE